MTGSPRDCSPVWGRVWRIALVFVSVVGGMFLSFAFFPLAGANGTPVYPVWPASGINMGMLWVLGIACWPGVALGSFVANLIQYEGTEMMWRYALLAPIGDTLEAVLGVWLLRRVADVRSPLTWVGGIARFVVFCALVATGVGAVVGLGLLGVDHRFNPPVMLRDGFVWLVSTSIAVLVIMPMVILWRSRWRRVWDQDDLMHALLIALLLGAVQGWLFFRNGDDARVPPEPLVLLSLPLVFWAGSRFGVLGSAATVFFAAVTAIIGTREGLGPFRSYPPDLRQTMLQIYLGVIALVGLFSGAVSCEREAARNQLERQAAFDRLLFDELNHRVRNTLASLLAMLDLGKNEARTVDEYSTLVSARIHAMARVHDMLTDQCWKPVAFRVLFESVSADAPPAGRVDIRGDEVMLAPSQAVAMGMVLHELLTNAHRHGALAFNDGSVLITLDYDQAVQRLVLEWDEHTPSIVSVRWKPGDGMRLIEGLTRSDLRGSVNLHITETGARHRFLIRLEPALVSGLEVAC